MSGDFDIFGVKGSKKRKKTKAAFTMNLNRERGRTVEGLVGADYMSRGFKVERTGRGSDFRVKDPRTGRSRLIEVKSGNAKLSPLQQKTKKRQRTKVERRSYIF